MDWLAYNSISSLVSFTSGAAGTCYKVGAVSMGGIESAVYAALITVSSATVATAGVGTIILKKDNKLPIATTTLCNFPSTDIFLTCPCTPLSKGIVGNAVMIFAKPRESMLFGQNSEVGVYFYSEAIVANINAMVTILTKPQTLGC